MPDARQAIATKREWWRYATSVSIYSGTPELERRLMLSMI